MSRSDKPSPPSRYVSPNELAHRWQCDRTTVDRYARSAGLTRFCPGDGANGSVRYLRAEVEEFERRRSITPRPDQSGDSSHE